MVQRRQIWTSEKINDVTWHWKVKVVTPIYFVPIISEMAGDRHSCAQRLFKRTVKNLHKIKLFFAKYENACGNYLLIIFTKQTLIHFYGCLMTLVINGINWSHSPTKFPRSSWQPTWLVYLNNLYLHHYKSPTALLDNRYASPHLWNQLPSLFRQPHSVYCPPGSPHPAHITSSQSSPSFSPSVTPSTFHSRLKTHLFHKSFPPL